MKKQIYVILLLIFLGSCKNQEVDFPDFKYNAVYFPVQFPARTLSLGTELYDNSLDKQLTFKIGVDIGGMYENQKDWLVEYVVDPTLTTKLTTNGVPVTALPASYISSVVPEGKVIIPKGSFEGWITVKLTEAFLDDPMSYTNKYVLPLRITKTDADSILSGKPAVSNPDKRITSNWDAGAPPKDFTLYGIKYVNKIHGSFLHRGKEEVYSSSNVLLSTKIFHQSYIIADQLIKLKTTGRYSVVTNSVSNTVSDDGKNGMNLTFDASGNIVVTPVTGLVLKPSGTGKYVEAANSTEKWGDAKRDAIYLDYQYTDATNNRHAVKDTLVFRDRGIVYETMVVTVTP